MDTITMIHHHVGRDTDTGGDGRRGRGIGNATPFPTVRTHTASTEELTVVPRCPCPALSYVQSSPYTFVTNRLTGARLDS